MGRYLDITRKFEEGRQAEVRTPLTVVPPHPAPESWPCLKCGREAVIEAVEPSLDGERMLTFWHCEPCQRYAVTPDEIRQPPAGWGRKTRQLGNLVQDTLIPDHKRYWVDTKKQPWCADCFPPADGIVVIDVTSTVNDSHYEREERIGIQQEE